MTEVKRGKVKEVDDEDELSPDEVGSDEEHDESELEEVVHDEMASNTCGGIDVVSVGGEEVCNIANLEDEEDDPV
jgi:hypothetical protein